MSEEKYINKEISQIINFYRGFSRFLFWSWIYILLAILSWLFVFFIIWIIKINLTWDILNSNIIIWEIKNKEITKANKIQILENYNKNWIKFDILWWYIYNSWNEIYSYNNLSSFKNIILPYSFYIESWSLQKYDKNTKNTDYKFLTNFVLANILIKNERKWEIELNYDELKPLKEEKIEKTFNLTCLNSIIISPFCQKEIDKVFNNLYLYDISKDIYWMKNLYENLKNKWYKDQICQTYQKYTIHSLDFNENFYTIFKDCWEEYLKNYELMKDFSNINNSIINNKMDNKIFSNKNINAYKLLSFQKLIYINYEENKNFNVDLIWMYLSFLENIIKDQKIWNPYYDISYLYNNFYLSKILTEQKSNVNQKISEAIPKLTESINKINKWDNFFITKWLEKLIVNKTLINILNSKNNNLNLTTNTNLFPINKFQNLIDSLNWYYSIETWINPKDNSVYYSKWNFVKTFLVNNSDTKEIKLSMQLNYKYDWNNFKLKDVKIEKYTDLQSVINNKLEKDIYFGFSEMIELIKSYPLDKTWKIDFCERLNDVIIKISSKELISVDNCSENNLKITQWKISYNFKFNWELLEKNSIIISDKEIQKSINETLNWNSNIIKDNFLSILPNILILKEEESKNEIINNIISVKVKFQHSFGTEIESIETIDKDNFHLKFTLDDYNMECDINKKENYRIYNLIINWENNQYNLSNFSLSLLESEKNKINKFRTDPIWYIKEYYTK